MFNLLSKPETTLKDQPQRKHAIKPGQIKKLQPPGHVYGVTTTGRGTFEKSEYDLGEVAKVIDIEAYARQSFNKHCELCLKEGYKIKSKSLEATEYIKKRLREIGEASDRTFDSLLRGIVTNVVQYSNCFVVKARSLKDSSGSMRHTASGKELAPVAGYFLLDPTSIEIKRNVHGKVTGYQQKISGTGTSPEFSPYDVIHIFYDRKEGFAFGTPFIIPVLDDIRSLRRLEENIEMLMLSHLYPLFHYIVGTEQHPAEVYEDGTTEVDIIKDEIENMPTEGSIVTPERHEIKVLGAEGKAIVADPYLKHFELRVLAGLGISEIALGRGGTANRATAATIDKGMQDRCKDFQDVIETFVDEYIFKELLLEGGFNIEDEIDNIVTLKFSEIDIETQIKSENHTVFKYEHDIITETEARGQMGMDPISEEQRDDMFFEHVTKPKAIILAVDEPFTSEAKGASVQKVSKEEKKKKATNEREQPSNQHGRKLAKTTTKKDELLREAISDMRKAVGDDVEAEDMHNDTDEAPIEVVPGYNVILTEKLSKEISKHWALTKEDVIEYIKQTYIEENRNLRDFTPEKLRMILFLTKDSVIKSSASYVFQAFKDGMQKAASEMGMDSIDLKINPAVKYKYLEERIDYYTSGLISDLGVQLIKEINPDFSDRTDKKIEREEVILHILGVFDALEYRIKFTAHTEILKSFNFGYALAMREVGYGELYLKLASNHCNICKEAAKKPLSLEYFAFEDVAPIHPMCNCTYAVRKK